MSLPIASTRNVVIEGVACRWKLSHPKGGPPVLLVQATTGNGRLLVVETARETEGMYWLRGKCGAITLDDVQCAASAAVAAGWNPNEPGKPFRMDRVGNVAPER